MNHLNLFTSKSDLYAKYRPGYARAFINEMVTRGLLGPQQTVADIGAGTGILSVQLISTGATLYAVEPNEGMLKQLSQALQGTTATILPGTAEKIPLPSSSIDNVFVGQAFHWFDPGLFRKECQRILKPDGYVILVWNRKAAGEMETARKAIVNRYHHAIDSYQCSWDMRIEGIAAFFDNHFECLSFANDLIETREEFIGRTLSASHALESSDVEIDTYLTEWNTYFNSYQKDGLITIPNDTIAFFGKPGSFAGTLDATGFQSI